MSDSVEMKEVIKAMIKAPSAHNTQPWQFVIRGDGIDIFVDEKRHLPVSDPTYRQLYISIGCAVTNGLVAVAAQGGVGRVVRFPEGRSKSKPAVRLVIEDGEADRHLAGLAQAVKERRTDRNLYDSKVFNIEEKSALKSSVGSSVIMVTEKKAKDEVARLTAEGSFKTLVRKDFKEELSHWVRNSWTKQPDGMPGYAMGIPAPLSLLMPLIVKVAPIHKQEQTSTAKQINSASAVAVMVTRGDEPLDWLICGEVMELLWLEAVAGGMAAAPLAAAVEAGEDIRNQLQKVLKTNLYPQALLRIGHSKEKDLKATPRRTVKNSLKNSG